MSARIGTSPPQNNTMALKFQCPKSLLGCTVPTSQLTGSFDDNLHFPRASSFGEDFEVGHFLDSHPFGLQASPRGSTRIGIACWKKHAGQINVNPSNASGCPPRADSPQSHHSNHIYQHSRYRRNQTTCWLSKRINQPCPLQDCPSDCTH